MFDNEFCVFLGRYITPNSWLIFSVEATDIIPSAFKTETTFMPEDCTVKAKEGDFIREHYTVEVPGKEPFYNRYEPNPPVDSPPTDRTMCCHWIKAIFGELMRPTFAQLSLILINQVAQKSGFLVKYLVFFPKTIITIFIKVITTLVIKWARCVLQILYLSRFFKYTGSVKDVMSFVL